MRLRAALFALFAAGCGVRTTAPAGPHADARGGFAPRDFHRRSACGSWRDAAGASDPYAKKHDSFPELDPRASCFVPVRHEGGRPKPGPVPEGCGFSPADVRPRLLREAERYERVLRGDGADVPSVLSCALPAETRLAAARVNAATLRALAGDPVPRSMPYAAVSTFGYGRSAQDRGVLLAHRPGGACPRPGPDELSALSVNVPRAERAAQAFHAGVAPVITVSGGAVHSKAVEAFLLEYLATCRFGVPRDCVLLDPCADHTHTNLRNTASLILQLGGRTAYVVTDDGLQSDYLDEWSLANLLGGSIDERALQDFGFLLGSWRRASVGGGQGFWFTPYRFWREPLAGLGGFTCAR